MSDVQFSERVRKADRWSKFIALLVAIGVFLGSVWLTEAPQLSSISAAGAGIGARFFIPYWVSQSMPAEERTSIEEHPGTGNFHHGALGVALLLGSFVLIGVLASTEETNTSLWLGFTATGLGYVVIAELLPRG